MSGQSFSRRRDPRHSLRPGVGFVEFGTRGSGSRDRRADLNWVSVAGLTFEADADPDIEPGTLLEAATVCVGECEVEGELSVKSVRRVNESRLETGCLFYPSSYAAAEKWSAVIAVIQAVCGD